MGSLTFTTLIQLFRRRRTLLWYKRTHEHFAGSIAEVELNWVNHTIDVFLAGFNISELTDHLAKLNNEIKK